MLSQELCYGTRIASNWRDDKYPLVIWFNHWLTRRSITSERSRLNDSINFSDSFH